VHFSGTSCRGSNPAKNKLSIMAHLPGSKLPFLPNVLLHLQAAP
jgi:hypothetical protein